MPLVEEDAINDAFDGLVDCSIGKNNIRGLAAQFQRVFFAGTGNCSLDDSPDLGRTCESYLVDIRVIDDGRARIACTGNDVDHAWRQVGVTYHFCELHRSQRCRLRRLQYDGIAAGECRRYLPRGHQQREIPGNDLAGNS